MASRVLSTISVIVPCHTSVFSAIRILLLRTNRNTLYPDLWECNRNLGGPNSRATEASCETGLRVLYCGRLAHKSAVHRKVPGGCFAMQLRAFCVAFLATALPLAAQTPATPSDLSSSADRQLPALTETYKHLHRNPELSRHEEQTSAFLAGELRKAGYTVTEHVGKYEDGTQAFGVVAILENGAGPRVLIRTDMDALPVEERTGLDYASTVKSTNAQGQQVGVMQACGHDLHMTVFLGMAREMAARKSQWHGTLMLIGQPSEEIIEGAAAMLADHQI